MYAILRDSADFANNVYFDYAWLLINNEDFELQEVQAKSKVAFDKINAEGLLKFIKEAVSVHIEGNQKEGVLEITSVHKDPRATLKHLTNILNLLLEGHAKAFQFLHENPEFLVLTRDPEMFSLFINQCPAAGWHLKKKRDEDLLTWQSRVYETLWKHK